MERKNGNVWRTIDPDNGLELEHISQHFLLLPNLAHVSHLHVLSRRAFLSIFDPPFSSQDSCWFNSCLTSFTSSFSTDLYNSFRQSISGIQPGSNESEVPIFTVRCTALSSEHVLFQGLNFLKTKCLHILQGTLHFFGDPPLVRTKPSYLAFYLQVRFSYGGEYSNVIHLLAVLLKRVGLGNFHDHLHQFLEFSV